MKRVALLKPSSPRSALIRLGLVFATLAGLLTVGQSPATSQTANPQGRWFTVGPLKVARFHHTATLMADGRVLVAGGRSAAFASFTSAEVFSPRTMRSVTTGSMADDRWRHTATALPNGKVLVAGGFTDSTSGSNAQPVTDTVELYDPSTGQWSPTGALKERRALHAARLLPNGQVLVAGGRTCNQAPPTECNFTFRSKTAELYDPATGQWTLIAPMNLERHTTEAALLQNGKVLVPAGFTTAGNGLNGDVYDPVAGTWTLTGNLTTGRARQGAVTLPDGRVLVTAGFGGGATSELYNPATNTWSATGNVSLSGRFNFYTGLLPNGKVLIAGGGPGSPRASAELYDPASGTWSAAPDMPNAHGTTSSLGNTDPIVVLSGNPNTYERSTAACANRCGAALVIGNNPGGTVDMYAAPCPTSAPTVRFACVAA